MFPDFRLRIPVMFHNSQSKCAFCFFYISACMIPWECLETREQTIPNIRVLQIKPLKKKPKKQHVPKLHQNRGDTN